MNQYIMLRFYVVHFQGGSYVHRIVFLISTQFCCTAYVAIDLLGNSTHNLEPFSLRSRLSLYIASLTIYSSLTLSLCQSPRIVTYILTKSATGYSKIITD